MSSRTGGRSGLWTAANVVTVVRVALMPVWLALAETDAHPLATFLLFLVIALSDSLDGYLARSRDEVTTFGKFLDPIADKLVVVVTLCYLLERGLTSSWVLLVIVTREFLVSGLRMVVASSGEVVAASMLGKVKTATTLVSIGLLLASMAFDVQGVLALLGRVGMVAAVVLTAWSGIDYFVKCWPYLADADGPDGSAGGER